MATDLWDLFRDPPRRFSPVPLWWWSGEALDPARLRWQLERLVDGGIYNLVILNLAPSGPLYGADPDVPAFQSADWWATVRQVCADARALGVSLWFYDQIGFSGANLQADIVRHAPTFAGRWLARLVADASGPVDLHCPTGGEPLAGCALPLTDDGAPAGPPVSLLLTGPTLRWTGTGRHQLMLFYTVTRGFDYFQPAACRALFERMHGEFARHLGDFLGSVIVGSFQDELPSLPTWSPLFADEFQQRRGYDLVARLVHLWEDLGDESAAVRGDYHQVRAELAEGAFFQPLFAWHEQHGLVCGFDQQGPARAGFPIEATRDYADYLRTHRWYGLPGSDHHGEAKVHSSLAHLYDRPGVWIEAFHSSGWGGTLEETFDWLLPWLRAGATVYNPHAVYYSTRGGWWEWAPPSTCWRQPYWRHYPQFATAIRRLCAVLSQGDHICDIGILYPTATVQAGLTLAGATDEAQAAHATYLALVGHMHWQTMSPGLLDQDRRDFDVLDDASVQRATIEAGALCIGAERYRAILLPACATLAAATTHILHRFVEAGGLLVAVGARPHRLAGRYGDPAPPAALDALFSSGHARSVATVEQLPGALADLPRRVEAPVPTLLRRVGELSVLFIPAAFPCATRPHPGQRFPHAAYDFDPERYAREMTVTVQGVAGAPELWDLTTGTRRLLAAHQTGDSATMTVPFAEAPAAVLVWGGAPTGTADSTVAGQPVEIEDAYPPAGARLDELSGPWEVELIPTLDNRWGDVARPAAPGAPPVQRWRFRYRREQPGEDGLADGWAGPAFDDTGWDEVHATYGVQGWWYGPGPAASLPPPHTGHRVDSMHDPLAAAGWRPAVYSLTRGIFRDPLHQTTLGPKGHVPEEFLDFGRLPAGDAVQYRTAFHQAAAAPLVLAIGAAAAKAAWLNGQHLGSDTAGYLWLQPVQVRAGWNVLEFRLTAEEMVDLRASFALVRDAAAFRRPEWLMPTDPPMQASRLRFQHTFTLAGAPRTGRLHLATDAPARLFVNDHEIGRQGGFEPYGGMASVQLYEITAALRAGANTIAIEVLDLGRPCAMLLDALIGDSAGRERRLISDEHWALTRDERAIPLTLRRRQRLDPAWAHLVRRPHPLPGSTWLEDAADEVTVVPLAPDPCPGERRVEWLRFALPPGAEAMMLPLAGDLQVFVNAVPVPVVDGWVRLPAPDSTERCCAVRIADAGGGLGGALLQGPVQFRVGAGRMELGDWEARGLSAYAGGVAYRRAITLPADSGGPVWLDLGRVRGTAEVWVNGLSAGSRVWSPYRFDVTNCLQQGVNSIEIQVFNTLAPYLAAVSPTHYVFPGQTVSGLFGPVRLVVPQPGP